VAYGQQNTGPFWQNIHARP